MIRLIMDHGSQRAFGQCAAQHLGVDLVVRRNHKNAEENELPEDAESPATISDLRYNMADQI